MRHTRSDPEDAVNAGDYSWLVTYDDDVLADPDPVCETSTVSVTD
jgi:hypothetical protein